MGGRGNRGGGGGGGGGQTNLGDILSTTNHKWTGLESNLGFRDDRLVTIQNICFSHHNARWFEVVLTPLEVVLTPLQKEPLLTIT